MPLNDPIPVTAAPTGREVRLRPEYGEVYPELPAGLWLPADQVAAVVVRRASAARRLAIHRRTLDPAHFEFRGGQPRGGGGSRRRSDR
jgi:hypothetical protein